MEVQKIPAFASEPRARIALPLPREAASRMTVMQKCDWDGSGKKWKNCGLQNTEEHQRFMAAKK